MNVVWWKSPHLYGAAALLVLGITMRHVPQAWKSDVADIYPFLAAAGLISAKQSQGKITFSAPDEGEGK